MKAALYAIRLGGAWKVTVSLDFGVDIWWWGRNAKEHDGGFDREPDLGGFRESNSLSREDIRVEGEGRSFRKIEVLLLSSSMPLGWAMRVKESFRSKQDIDHWQPGDWMKYIAEVLNDELNDEIKPAQGGAAENLWREVPCRVDLNARMKEGGGMEWPALWELAARVADALEGRSLLEAELQQLLAERLPELGPAWRSAVQLAHLQGRVQLTAGVGPADDAPARPRPLARRGARLRCRRCGSGVHHRTPCGSCGSGGCAYCEACLALGRSRSCALLLRGSSATPAMPRPEGGIAPAPTASLTDRWGLSPAQREAAGAALQFLAQPLPLAARPKRAAAAPARFLLWAVTGAGKTEMIFPLLQFVLDRGGKALVATPRRDVVLELAPRIGAAFPENQPVVLYGGSPQRWEEGRLYLSTTHQLMRFYHTFDLVIIDELDAFPYHNDPMLAFAAESCCKPGGRFVFLSATPPAGLQREAKAGKLPYAKVPARFHGHPLPVPKRISMKPVEVCLRQQTFPAPLLASLEKSARRDAQIFVFVSRIRHIDPVVQLLRRRFPDLGIEGTSSQDKDRGDNVLRFRAAQTRILVTTTILERGVTVPRSDVYIFDADSELFDEASLVQMAGRAGRSKDDPAGMIIFASPEWTRAQRGAIRQIRRMNAIAHKKGFLKSYSQ